MSLHVVDPGLSTLIVDLGRSACRSLGVPVGGAADRTSLILGNALVGNPPDAAALEISLAGPRLRADTELACVVYGAPFALTGSQHPNRDSLAVGKTFTLHAQEELHIGGTATGMRAYLCVRGGIDAPTILGSRSALKPLSAGQELPCQPGTITPRSLNRSVSGLSNPGTLRVVAGAQAEWFDVALLCAGAYSVTPASDRMGLRLQGDPLRPRHADADQPTTVLEMVSEPVCPGTVQVTRDGQCIILGVDGQTIGGYPKIAHVISADLDKIGQLRPGQRLRFHLVTLAEAEIAYRKQQVELHEWVTRLQVMGGV